MRINQIDIKNFQGLHHAALVVSEPVLVVSGGNGAGKSSLLDAVAMAFTGNPSRVKLKRDIKQLITDGAKKSSVQISTSEGEFGTELPSTKSAVHFPDNPYLKFALSAESFSKLDDKERRKVLFELTGASDKPQVVADKMIARGIASDMVEKVKPLLLSGFPAATEQAKNFASEARGAWKQLTGETYGAQKAEGWKPETMAVTVTQEQLASALTSFTKAQSELDEAQISLGAVKAKVTQATARASRIIELKEVADLLERRKTKLERDQDDLVKWEAKLADAKAAGGELKQGLVHDLARSLHGVLPYLVDTEEVVTTAKSVLDAYELEHGSILGSGDPELAKRTGEYQGYVSKLQSAVANAERDVSASVSAAAALSELENEDSVAVTEDAINNAEELINELRQKRDSAQAKLVSLEEAFESVDKQASLAAEAAHHHAQVQAWSEISDALSPSGIPAEILQTALSPVNELLRKLSEMSGWQEVRINGDIEITYGERIYGLLSESEQWRADTMLSVALSNLSGLRFVLLDRFDVLEPSARPQAIKLLLGCAKSDLLDQSVMAGTMKSPMSKVPQGIQQAWIAEGVITEEGKAA